MFQPFTFCTTISVCFILLNVLFASVKTTPFKPGEKMLSGGYTSKYFEVPV